MSLPTTRPPPPGVWCPAVTLFDPETDTLDLAAQRAYFAYLGTQTGLAGLLVLGTNAETFLLTREERRQLLALAREVLGPDFPIMAGVGGHSSCQVGEFVRDAVEVGVEWYVFFFFFLFLGGGYGGGVGGAVPFLLIYTP
jgi:dihydrodipicolinate synthase/N-acetylneuraminate lyase